MLNKSRLFGVFCALAVVPSVVVSAAHAENIYDDTRYNNVSPAESVKDFLTGISTGFAEKFNDGIQTLADSFRDNVIDSYKPFWVQFIESAGQSTFDAIVHAQRVKDLVDYANQSTTGLTSGKNVYAFTAKRKLLLGSQNGEQQYELDTLYFWRDYNHTVSTDFTGVTIGDFFLQPNTFYCTRQFSNGDFMCFYGDATQFSFGVSQDVATYVNQPFSISFTAGQTYYIINPDGTTEQLTFRENSTAAQNSTLRFKILDNNYNAIDEEDFQKQAQYFPSFGQYITDGRLSNIQLICNNATKSDGSMMRPNNYAGSADGWDTWYLSSGSFLGNDQHSNSNIPRSFTVDNDPTNYDPRKPPANYNTDPLLYTNKELTINNYNDYADYGITYNSSSNQFELDLDALAAGIAGLISPDFAGVFDLVYDAQPDIGGNDWTNLNNNFNNDFDNTIIDITDLNNQLKPVEPFTVPYYAPVNTSAFIPAQYPTIPVTATFHPNYVKAVGNTLNNGWNLFDSLGLCAILVPVVIMLLVWRLTGR